MSAESSQSLSKPPEPRHRRPQTADKLIAEGPRVVIGVDGTVDSVAALLWAAREAYRRGAILHIVSAWEDDAPASSLACPPGRRIASRRLNRALKQVLREQQRPDRIACASAQGPAGQVLLDTARGADLLVMGTAADDNCCAPGVIGLYCLRHAQVPVVFVPGPFRA